MSSKNVIPMSHSGEGNVTSPQCDLCEHFRCTRAKDCYGQRKDRLNDYRSQPELLKLVEAAAKVEAQYYGKATRIEEILHFADEIGASHLGVAFCVGFKEEARLFCELMRRHFEVSSVCCKNCAIPKKTFSMPHVRPVKRENMCNPVGQAELLNQAGTGLNIVMGLCVGHDSVFFKKSNAPVTVVAVKDRVLAHNPIGALYSPYLLRRLREGPFS